MDKPLEKCDETLFLYMVSVARLFYTQRWKALSTMEEWLGEFSKMTKLTFDKR